MSDTEILAVSPGGRVVEVRVGPHFGYFRLLKNGRLRWCQNTPGETNPFLLRRARRQAWEALKDKKDKIKPVPQQPSRFKRI